MAKRREAITYGAEHEWADWPLDRALPKGFKRDERDITIVNSNGVANDPTGRLWRFGGEINTPPTDTTRGQADILQALLLRYPEAVVNYRSNLHIHIRVPGLRENLPALKRVQAHIHRWMPVLLPVLEPELSERPAARVGETSEEYIGAVRRWRRRRVSHGTLLKAQRVEGQLAAQTIEEFFEREVPRSSWGKPMWHAQPRICVNLRQLRETDTVEFRHFPGTLYADQMQICQEWCEAYLMRALDGEDCSDIKTQYAGLFQSFPAYSHWHERRYRATVHDGTLTREQIAVNIQQIVDGVFDG
jgi:hypothetical protein